MSGMTKRVVRSLTAMVVTAGSLVSLAGPAQAYDKGTCEGAWAADVVDDVDPIKIDTGTAGRVDFGDLPHPGGLGGAPQEPAVVCWFTNGMVGVVGRVFADSGHTMTTATAKITFYSNGVEIANSSRSVMGNHAASSAMSLWAYGRNFTRARIRLYSREIRPLEGPPADTLVHTSYYDRGD